MKRVVITGMGVVSPLGHNVETFFNNLLAGQNGIKKLSKFTFPEFPVHLAAEINDFDYSDLISKRDAKRLDLFSLYAVHSALQAFNDADLKAGDYDPFRFGCMIGSGAGGLITEEKQLFSIFANNQNYRKTQPLFLPKILANMASGNVAILLGAQGHNISINSACASGTHSLGEAFWALQRGDLDLIITGSTDAAISKIGMAGFAALRALSTSSEITNGSIPFSQNRNGFVMGEGAGALMLETLEHAQKRGAHIYGEIVGYGSTCDASHITAPSQNGPIRAMKAALQLAKLQPEDIGYINAHGTSTFINDVNETKAIKEVFGDHAYQLLVSSTKSMIGHCLGAAGTMEAVVCLKTLATGKVHPTINSKGDDPECDLNYVLGQAQRTNPQYAMSNSFGFGGHNAVVIFKKWEGQ